MVDKYMKLSILSSRNTEPNLMIALSFNVSFGPPSMIQCLKKNSEDYLFDPISSRIGGLSELSREVIRSHYVNSSYPDMTQVTITSQTTPREPGTYTCTVTVEGRANINGDTYSFHNKGDGTTVINITGQCVYKKLCEIEFQFLNYPLSMQ